MQIKSPPKIEGLKTGMWENLMTTNQHPFKSLFHRKKSSDEALSDSPHPPKPIPHLSSLANSVVFRCSKILQVSTEELQHRFDSEFPQNVKPSLNYGRIFLEFCSFRAINILSRRPDYLSDKEFCRMTYDVMLAWELPSAEIEPIQSENASRSDREIEDEDGSSLFYSNSTTMAVQVDDKKTVGPEAFARIAPVCVAIADVLTVHNLFNSLTSASGYRLHFLIYDKYLRSLDKVIKTARNALGPSISSLQLAEGEIILDIDGAVPIQPVLQHIGISAWPGRLTLTNYALYFESLGVGLYDKAVRYDLAMDMKQVIKPELTGPLGARLFDKAVMYKSTSVAEPVYFEFPEFKGNSRRDYWLDICLEILRAHRFLRKNNLKETKRLEVLSRAILGVYRYRAVREAFRIFSSNYKTLLVFNLAESLPGGDMILETLSSRLALLNASSAQHDDAGTMYAKCQLKLSPVSLLMLGQLGFIIQKEANLDENAIIVGDVCVGETNPLQMVVKQLISDTGRAEAAQATVDQVKVEGIDTNMAVMKELLLPVIELANSLQRLYSWEDPFKSTVFLVLACYAIYRDCIRYILSSISIFFAILMLWRRHFNRGKPLEAFRIAAPSNKNALGQLLTLQEAITHVESLIQAGNIILLKIRALLFAVLPQATDMVALLLLCMAAAFAFVPLRYLMLLIFLEAFTRETRVRKESSDKWVRRIREWWIRIPAAPVQLTKAAEKKKMK